MLNFYIPTYEHSANVQNNAQTIISIASQAGIISAK